MSHTDLAPSYARGTRADGRPLMSTTLIHVNSVDMGDHFAAWVEPALFAAELRSAFRSL
jgi:hypothetical protein